ncbi:hypothetical protein GCM10009687_55080 [Asanoa iriomotensis]|uniref:Uncharacterized protein n=1 Tax=Asanoa iriomotensis TaxID=234613 RepID=A0ABQ4C5M9_9ACTN|nr:hypothetical protein Air01nite_41830 [Asanoa iriomotensis]
MSAPAPDKPPALLLDPLAGSGFLIRFRKVAISVQEVVEDAQGLGAPAGLEWTREPRDAGAVFRCVREAGSG